jgi:hypothetical protein
VAAAMISRVSAKKSEDGVDGTLLSYLRKRRAAVAMTCLCFAKSGS